jgi:hypothetical protein
MREPARELLARARVRASRHYRLEPSVAPAEDHATGPSEWAGTLVPTREGWHRVQLVSRETAELFVALAEPAPLPAGVGSAAGARLVLDGILELEYEDGFHSGPETHAVFFANAAPTPHGALGRISHGALRCAAALAIPDPRLISKCLYRYNTRPNSPAWQRRFPDSDAIARLFEPGRAAIPPAWTGFFTPTEGGVSWRAWERPDAPAPLPRAPTYKMYISPEPTAVGAATRAVLALAGTRCAPFALKAGNNLPTLLRSEKLVVYFLSRDQLLEAADRLRPLLAGLPAQGVPFTAELFGDGLVSWGIDPGSDAEPPGPLRQLSWRRWITARLGVAMASALAAGRGGSAWQYALDRVRLDGVNPETWTAPAWFELSDATDVDH